MAYRPAKHDVLLHWQRDLLGRPLLKSRGLHPRGPPALPVPGAVGQAHISRLRGLPPLESPCRTMTASERRAMPYDSGLRDVYNGDTFVWWPDERVQISSVSPADSRMLERERLEACILCSQIARASACTDRSRRRTARQHIGQQSKGHHFRGVAG